ncbi:unnamed protein product, partial [Allacma fusca]
MVLCPITYSILALVLFLLNPDDPRYLYSALPLSSKSEWLLFLWSIVEYLHIIRFCCVFNTMLFIIIVYAHCTNFWLLQLSGSDAKNDNIVITKSQDKSEALKNYKIFQVMNVHFNHCFST